MVAFSPSSPGRRLIVRARAKVNLGLEVLGRRRDGYHELLTFLSAIDLADLVTLEAQAEGIAVECDAPEVPVGPANLAWRAAELIRDEARFQAGVRIRIAKSIPVAAGLGGGSADAAAVLLGLSRLWGVALRAERLRALATALGMDVPFFLGRGPALASARGEELRVARTARSVALVVVNPGFPLATREVYSRVRSEHFGSGARVRALAGAWPAGAHAIASRLCNALEGVVGGMWPGLTDVKQALLDAGALGAVMSGSGPTVVGVAPSKAAAVAIRGLLADRPWRTWIVQTVCGPALAVARGAAAPRGWGVAKR